MNNKGLVISVIAMLSICFFHINVYPQETPGKRKFPKEQIISVLIRNLSKHIKWPDSDEFGDSSKPFVIGLFAGAKFHKYFNALFSRRKIKNKRVSIKPIISKEDLEGCHLLFISPKGEQGFFSIISIIKGVQDFSSIISAIKDKPVLIISYSPEFTPVGVHINIVRSPDSTLSLELNVSRMKKSGLQTSNALLLSRDVVIIKEKQNE